ncbi:MAG: head-tail adaptor protein [Rhodobacteraceae bacterium]|jgi:head-tail adaptor|nr:head-tail adaptor protein [Paracoccaceae bacterium]
MAVPELNRALVLEAPQTAPDGAGGFALTWGALGTLWAEVVAGAGRDPAGEEVVLSSLALRITVRAAPPGAAARPVPGQRFREGARHFAILAVAERDRDGRFLLCSCREEAPI